MFKNKNGRKTGYNTSSLVKKNSIYAFTRPLLHLEFTRALFGARQYYIASDMTIRAQTAQTKLPSRRW